MSSHETTLPTSQAHAETITDAATAHKDGGACAYRGELDAEQRARILHWLEMTGGSAREALPRSRRGASGGGLVAAYRDGADGET